MVVAFSQTQHVPRKRHEWRGCVRRSKALNLSELQFFLFLFLKSLLFKTKSCYVIWSGLTFSAFLPQSLEGWDCRPAPWLPVSSLFIREEEIKWALQRASERLKRILKVKVEAHSRCSWKRGFLSSLPSRDPASWENSWALTQLHHTLLPGTSHIPLCQPAAGSWVSSQQRMTST